MPPHNHYTLRVTRSIQILRGPVWSTGGQPRLRRPLFPLAWEGQPLAAKPGAGPDVVCAPAAAVQCQTPPPPGCGLRARRLVHHLHGRLRLLQRLPRQSLHVLRAQVSGDPGGIRQDLELQGGHSKEGEGAPGDSWILDGHVGEGVVVEGRALQGTRGRCRKVGDSPHYTVPQEREARLEVGK